MDEILNGPIDRYNLRRFVSQSPFRQFFKMMEKTDRFSDDNRVRYEQQLSRKLILCFLAHEVTVANQREDEMWFNVGGVPHRFRQWEFGVLTGLRFSEIQPDDGTLDDLALPRENIRSRYWRKKKES